MRFYADRSIRILSLITLLVFSFTDVVQCFAQAPSVSLCQSCHPQITERWQNSIHARSMNSLPRHDQQSPSCRACHDDAGLRSLMQEQLQVHLTPSHDKKKYLSTQSHRRHELPATGVDCISCHGEKSQKISNVRHVTTFAAGNNASLLCSRCHQLPPLNREKICFDPHALTKLQKGRCFFVKQLAPLDKKDLIRSNLHHDRLKIDHAQGTTPQPAQTSLE